MADRQPPESQLKATFPLRGTLTLPDKPTFEITIHSFKKYVPGSGPPPAPISLAPPRDSTAYIIDQYVLPPLSECNEKTIRKLYYHIGFSDQPALKTLILANKVLDYVSPAEVEDWEYSNAERTARQKAEEMGKQKAAAAEASKKRGVGRPPKVRPEKVHVVEDGTPPPGDLPGPSLSTPPLLKTKLGPSVDELEVGLQAASSMPGRIHPEWARAYLRDDQSPLRPGENGRVQQDSEVEAMKPKQSLSKPRQVPYQPKITSLHQPKVTPVPLPPYRAPSYQPKITTPRQPKVTPIPLPPYQPKTSTPRQPKVNQVPLPSTVSKLGSSVVPTSSWTPAAVSKARLNPEASTGKRKTPSSSRDTSKEPREKKPKKANTKGVKSATPPLEQEWEVKELLADRWQMVDGVKVHQYLVLWVGDWPEGQNPTWEPAENIQDRTLIQAYQRKNSEGTLKPPKRALEQRKISQYVVTGPQHFTGSQYSNALEAFVGGVDEAGGSDADNRGESERDGGDLREEFLVTDDPIL